MAETTNNGLHGEALSLQENIDRLVGQVASNSHAALQKHSPKGETVRAVPSPDEVGYYGSGFDVRPPELSEDLPRPDDLLQPPRPVRIERVRERHRVPVPKGIDIVPNGTVLQADSPSKGKLFLRYKPVAGWPVRYKSGAAVKAVIPRADNGHDLRLGVHQEGHASWRGSTRDTRVELTDSSESLDGWAIASAGALAIAGLIMELTRRVTGEEVLEDGHDRIRALMIDVSRVGQVGYPDMRSGVTRVIPEEFLDAHGYLPDSEQDGTMG